MTKRYDEEIEVRQTIAGSGVPGAFVWRGRLYDVDQLLRSWREGGEWWDRSASREHEYHRVIARPAGALCDGELDANGFLRTASGVYDLRLNRLDGTWRLERVWD